MKDSPTLFRMVSVLLVFAGPALADLAVFPPSVQLDHGRDMHRVAMVETRPDGVTLDVTGEAVVALEPAGIAEWDAETRRVRPVADGEAVMTVTKGDLTVTVPVTVANATVDPVMSFRNDVEPVLTRAGCNAGGCHGSAQGKNGFRLSLFAYDPEYDFVSLTRDTLGRRMNLAEPEASLMLQKPTGAVAHEGGAVIEQGDLLYGILKRWIEEGAQDDAGEVPRLTGISVLPKQFVLEGQGSTQQIMVMATYSDGTDRDVTDLAILSSSDDLTLTVDAAGKVTAGDRGESYVMARFGTYAQIAKAIVIPAEAEVDWPDVAEVNYIDTLIFDKLKKLRISPAEPCSDSDFVRRVYLDILGKLPTVDEVRAFVADEASDKRARLIDGLLDRPEFAEVWAMKWADLLKVSTSLQLDRKGMHRYNDWLRQAVTQNKPLDELVRDLLTASGGNFAQPAANFYLTEQQPEQLAENVAQVFLGIQLQCAQCHNHPFEQWTMDDYYSFAAFFAQVGRKNSTDPREKIVFNRGSGEVKNLRDGQVMAPKFLGGAVPEVKGHDRRAVLADWLTSAENPWFAKNVANRVWAHFFGKGIIDPPDDVRVSNPPSHPDLLDTLGQKLVDSQYDLRALVRDICNSYTYQMSTTPRTPDAAGDTNFSYAQVRRLQAEPLLDAISQVTETNVKFANLPLGASASQVADGNSGNYFLSLFGRPARESVCTCERTDEPTLAQTLHLINGDTIDRAVKAPDGRLAKLLAAGGAPEAIAEELYLAALSRPPTADELAFLLDFVEKAEDKTAAWQDVLWGLLNTKEFVFNH